MEEVIQWLTENLSAEKLAIFGQFLVSGGALTWAVTIYNRFKTQTVQTPKNISNEVNANIKQSLTGSINPLKEQLEQIKAQNKVLAESLALLASNTPESRLALLSNISKIDGTSSIVAEATESVNKEIEQEKEHVKKIDDAIAVLETPVEFL
jgi:predicted PurR-regulated permease PerM